MRIKSRQKEGTDMNIGILGAGNIAQKLAEAVLGLQKQGYETVPYAVGARDLSRAEAFAQKYGFANCYGSYEDLVRDPDVDLIYVATPHSHHYEHTKLALEHGKHVLCEKAFTANAAQAEELIAFAREKQLLLAEAIWTRYMPARRMITELLDSGIIGTPCSLSANLCYPLTDKERMIRPELCGGALLDLGVYPINFACMTFPDEVRDITSCCRKWDTGVDAQDSISLTFADGKTAFLYCSMLTLSDRKGIINGSAGYMEVENINNPEEIRIYNQNRECIRRIAVPDQINGYEYEVLACMKALENGQTECPDMPHSETLRIMKFMDRLRKEWGVIYPFEN